MILLIFTVFYVGFGKIMQANLTFFESIAGGDKLDRSHVVLFMVPFGSKYAALKQSWQQLAKLQQIDYQFVEVDCYEHPDVQELFQMLHFPQIMFIDEEGFYYWNQSLVFQKLIYTAVLSQTYMNNFISGGWQRYTKLKVFRLSWIIHARKLLFNYIVQDALVGLGITLMIGIAVYIRLNIYKDEKETHHALEIASPISPNQEIELQMANSSLQTTESGEQICSI